VRTARLSYLLRRRLERGQKGRAMVAFDVFHNNERLCVAGVGDFGVLTAIVTWVAHSPETLERWAAGGMSEQQSTELSLQVGGLTSTLDMRWIDASLRVGEKVRIQVIDTPRVDAATTQYRGDAITDVEGKKSYVRRLAKELGWELRET
jgi:hypothetical protein